MDRTKFYVAETVNDKEEMDYLYNSLSNFKMKYLPRYYRVDSSDIMRPDMISYKNYGTVKYWWLLCFVNKVEDPFLGVEVGALFTIPNLLDIYDFYKKYKER